MHPTLHCSARFGSDIPVADSLTIFGHLAPGTNDRITSMPGVSASTCRPTGHPPFSVPNARGVHGYSLPLALDRLPSGDGSGLPSSTFKRAEQPIGIFEAHGDDERRFKEQGSPPPMAGVTAIVDRRIRIRCAALPSTVALNVGMASSYDGAPIEDGAQKLVSDQGKRGEGRGEPPGSRILNRRMQAD